MLSENIVVVDDDPRVFENFQIWFPEYEFIYFPDGEKAINFFRKPNVINLAFIDFKMPGKDGISVLQEIRKINKNLQVIFMSAYSSMDLAIEALRNQANDFIEKPFGNREELKTRIHTKLKEKWRLNKSRRNEDHQVQRIKRFIARNPPDVTLKDLADHLCLSPKYVSRMFNERNNLRFREYKLKIKMDKAKELLINSPLNINEISIELKYQNAESFMRIFRRLTKMTPTQYRKKNRSVPKRGNKKQIISVGKLLTSSI